MNEIISKLILIAEEAAIEKGSLDLLGLFLREEGPNQYDILFSAKWITRDRSGSLTYLAHKIQSRFTPDEFVKVTGIEFIDSDNPGLPEVLSVKKEDEIVELKRTEFFGMDMRRVYILPTGTKKAA
jgi:hypothetical protein